MQNKKMARIGVREFSVLGIIISVAGNISRPESKMEQFDYPLSWLPLDLVAFWKKYQSKPVLSWVKRVYLADGTFFWRTAISGLESDEIDLFHNEGWLIINATR